MSLASVAPMWSHSNPSLWEQVPKKHADKCHCQRGGLPASVDMIHLNGVEKSSSIGGRSTERVNRWNKDSKGALLTRQSLESRLTLVAPPKSREQGRSFGLHRFYEWNRDWRNNVAYPSLSMLSQSKEVGLKWWSADDQYNDQFEEKSDAKNS